MKPQALLFDMDGTLTRPILDFPAIKAEMGIGQRPILEALTAMPAAERLRAEAILHRHEDHAAEHSVLNAGCEALLDWVTAQKIPLALITRNRRQCVEVVMRRHGLKIDVLITRDDGLFKPDPQPLRIACQRLGAAPEQAWMIGDGEYDVRAGLAAGARTVWISHGQERPFPDVPWLTVPDLHQLLNVLRASVSQ